MFRRILSVGFAGAIASASAGALAQQTTVPMAANAPSTSTELNALILGSGSPQFDPKRGGASVLVRHGNTEILVDIGNGTQARLEQLQLPISALDGLLFTHQHLDHNEEFIPVFIRALLGNNKFVLAGPAPMRKMADSTLELYQQDIEYRMQRSGRKLKDVAGNYTVRELTGGDNLMIGAIKISTVKVNHSIYATALRFDAGDRSIVVTGDLTYTPALSVLAKDADYLIIDSGGTIKVGGTDQRQRGPGGRGSASGRRNAQDGRGGVNAKGGQRAHVTLEETARMAAAAGAKNLVLTHFTPGEIDQSATIAELSKTYKGRIIFGADLMAVDRFAR
jgi:ribonuclease BN (tRNA processing enzyme)